MQNIFKLNNPKLAGLAQVASRKYICSHKTSCRLYMKIQTFLIIIGINAANALSPGLQAQTCRVTAGYTADGQRNYIEVFEFDYVDEKPEFPGGGTGLLSYINEHRRYPARAYASGVEGRVTCSFVVNPDGKVSNVTVLRGVEPSLNKEAVRILTGMPNWTPGKMSGQPVPVRVVCAVPFRK